MCIRVFRGVLTPIYFCNSQVIWRFSGVRLVYEIIVSVSCIINQFRWNSAIKPHLWGYYSTSELFRFPEWWEEIFTSVQGSFGERSLLSSRFAESLLLDIPGTATEQVRTRGFRRKSSRFDRAPKTRDFVLLNSFESFLVTLPSISSEIWQMHSWAISGSSVFCDWLFLVFSGVSLETAAKFFLFLRVTMILREKFCQQWRLNWSFLLLTKC